MLTNPPSRDGKLEVQVFVSGSGTFCRLFSEWEDYFLLCKISLSH